MKRYLVTGAANGIGFATASRLASDNRGSCWIGLVDRDCAGLSKVAAHLDDLDAQTCEIAVDLADASVFDLIRTRAGNRLDGVVSNAGIITGGTLCEMDERDFDRVLDINLRGAWRLARTIHPLLKAGGGAFVATTSVVASEACAGVGAYAISKAALAMMVRQLSLEWATDGIRCNCVAPGSTWSKMTEAGFADDAHRARREAGIPLGRLGSADDCADGIAFLLSDRAKYITGTTLTIDGGFSNALMLTAKPAVKTATPV